MFKNGQEGKRAGEGVGGVILPLPPLIATGTTQARRDERPAPLSSPCLLALESGQKTPCRTSAYNTADEADDATSSGTIVSTTCLAAKVQTRVLGIEPTSCTLCGLHSVATDRKQHLIDDFTSNYP